MSSLSPESLRVPIMAGKFLRAGIIPGMIKDAFLSGEVRPRDFAEDMRLLSEQQSIHVEGLEHLPSQGGGLIIFNHPEVHIIAPAVFALPVYLKDLYGRTDFSILMGSELPLFGKKYAVPGSPELIRRLAKLYPETFILVAANKRRQDYRSVRDQVRLKTIDRITQGGLVALSPEAQISRDGSILPPHIYRRGSGEIGQLVTSLGLPIIPTAVWQEDDSIRIKIGNGFGIDCQDPTEAVTLMMSQIAQYLPNELRGPFSI